MARSKIDKSNQPALSKPKVKRTVVPGTAEEAASQSQSKRRRFSESAPKFDVEFVSSFLIRYNYHDQETVDSKSLRKAIERYQAFHALPVTGEMDAVTLSLIYSPRCGIPEDRKLLNDVLRQAKRTLRDVSDIPQKHKSQAITALSATTSVLDYTKCRWNKAIHHLTYCVDQIPTGMDQQAVLDACKSAFETWSNALQVGSDPPLITFSLVDYQVSPPVTPNIKILWVTSAQDPDGELGSSVSHADYPCGKHPVPKPLHLDASSQWSVTITVTTQFDFQTILLHEIGHILGFFHAPQSVQGSIMHDPLPMGFVQHQPSATDIQVLQKRYGLKP